MTGSGFEERSEDRAIEDAIKQTKRMMGLAALLLFIGVVLSSMFLSRHFGSSQQGTESVDRWLYIQALDVYKESRTPRTMLDTDVLEGYRRWEVAYFEEVKCVYANTSSGTYQVLEMKIPQSDIGSTAFKMPTHFINIPREVAMGCFGEPVHSQTEDKIEPRALVIDDNGGFSVYWGDNYAEAVQ